MKTEEFKMKIEEFKKYTNNLKRYTVDEIDNFTPMTTEEIDQLQYELENNTDNYSTWDVLRAIITLKQQSNQYKERLI